MLRVIECKVSSSSLRWHQCVLFLWGYCLLVCFVCCLCGLCDSVGILCVVDCVFSVFCCFLLILLLFMCFVRFLCVFWLFSWLCVCVCVCVLLFIGGWGSIGVQKQLIGRWGRCYVQISEKRVIYVRECILPYYTVVSCPGLVPEHIVNHCGHGNFHFCVTCTRRFESSEH